MLSGVGSTSFLYVLLLVGTLFNLILSPGAMMAVLPAPFAQLSLNLGMNPLPSLLTIIYSTDFVFLPHTVPGIPHHVRFRADDHENFIKLHLMKMVWFALLFGLVQIPYWHFFNIMMRNSQNENAEAPPIRSVKRREPHCATKVAISPSIGPGGRK